MFGFPSARRVPGWVGYPRQGIGAPASSCAHLHTGIFSRPADWCRLRRVPIKGKMLPGDPVFSPCDKVGFCVFGENCVLLILKKRRRKPASPCVVWVCGHFSALNCVKRGIYAISFSRFCRLKFCLWFDFGADRWAVGRPSGLISSL